jgi:hypothetical protein
MFTCLRASVSISVHYCWFIIRCQQQYDTCNLACMFKFPLLYGHGAARALGMGGGQAADALVELAPLLSATVWDALVYPKKTASRKWHC